MTLISRDHYRDAGLRAGLIRTIDGNARSGHQRSTGQWNIGHRCLYWWLCGGHSWLGIGYRYLRNVGAGDTRTKPCKPPCRKIVIVQSNFVAVFDLSKKINVFAAVAGGQQICFFNWFPNEIYSLFWTDHCAHSFFLRNNTGEIWLGLFSADNWIAKSCCSVIRRCIAVVCPLNSNVRLWLVALFHAPTLHQLEQPVTWRSQAGIVLAIGIRPCSGAVLVLLAAQAFGMRSTGIAAVASMSLGTAATVAACALLSTYARTFSLRLAGSQTTGTGEIVGVIGGIVIMLFGAILFAAGVSAPVYPLL